MKAKILVLILYDDGDIVILRTAARNHYICYESHT